MATTLLALTDKENPRTKRYATTSYSCVAQKGTIAFGVSHGFRVGDHVAVSGANEDAYNGVFEVISVDSLTAVSVLMPGAPPGAATGTPFVSRIIEAAHTGFPLLIDPKSGRLLVDGAGGGGGAGVSAPTRTDIVQLYTYDPNQGGATAPPCWRSSLRPRSSTDLWSSGSTTIWCIGFLRLLPRRRLSPTRTGTSSWVRSPCPTRRPVKDSRTTR